MWSVECGAFLGGMELDVNSTKDGRDSSGTSAIQN
jgi:hypothetical protein